MYERRRTLAARACKEVSTDQSSGSQVQSSSLVWRPGHLAPGLSSAKNANSGCARSSGGSGASRHACPIESSRLSVDIAGAGDAATAAAGRLPLGRRGPALSAASASGESPAVAGTSGAAAGVSQGSGAARRGVGCGQHGGTAAPAACSTAPRQQDTPASAALTRGGRAGCCCGSARGARRRRRHKAARRLCEHAPGQHKGLARVHLGRGWHQAGRAQVRQRAAAEGGPVGGTGAGTLASYCSRSGQAATAASAAPAPAPAPAQPCTHQKVFLLILLLALAGAAQPAARRLAPVARLRLRGAHALLRHQAAQCLQQRHALAPAVAAQPVVVRVRGEAVHLRRQEAGGVDRSSARFRPAGWPCPNPNPRGPPAHAPAAATARGRRGRGLARSRPHGMPCARSRPCPEWVGGRGGGQAGRQRQRAARVLGAGTGHRAQDYHQHHHTPTPHTRLS